MTFDNEFKKALQLITDKDKDKLILRLLKRDLQLANRLRFELVDTDSVNDKRELIRNRIIKRIQLATERYYSAGYLLMDLREISGEINEHVSITKDKFGEISLNCLMLRYMLELNNAQIAIETKDKAYTLCTYVIARVFKILVLMQKHHEDLHLEFKEDIEAIGEFIGNNHNLLEMANSNGLDVGWLIEFNIPENIADIQKELRRNGLRKKSLVRFVKK